MSKTFNMVGGGAGGGPSVVANPAMTGTEIDLQGLEVSGTKYKVPLIRPNLLDNWYFVGGGDQQGAGIFPINQRGQTVYTEGTAYGIDRWKGFVTAGEYSLDLLSDYISITTKRNYHRILQIIPCLKGQRVTYSMLFKGGDNARIGVWRNSNGGHSGSVYADGSPTDWTLVSGSVILPTDEDFIELRIFPTTSSTIASKTLLLQAAKLELGSTQTLAHNEGTEANPVWVLNEIPNYTEELWRCQRYYQLFASSSYRPTYGEDYRPPMRLHSPTEGTISIGGTTYYYADANL